MDKKTNYTSDELLNLEFTSAPRGYDPLEVDETLDKIIADYELFEKSSGSSNVDVDKLIKEIEELKKANLQLKGELDKERNKWKYISKDHRDIHIDNYELLQRIGKLEMIIYEKLNMNPDEIR